MALARIFCFVGDEAQISSRSIGLWLRLDESALEPELSCRLQKWLRFSSCERMATRSLRQLRPLESLEIGREEITIIPSASAFFLIRGEDHRLRVKPRQAGARRLDKAAAVAYWLYSAKRHKIGFMLLFLSADK
jgi:hypothetical protein